MRFYPEPPPHLDTEEGRILAEYLYRQLLQISGEQTQDLDKSGMVPPRYVDGMLRYADGTGWDPGNGEGLYAFFKNRWNYVTTTPTDGVWEDLLADLSGAQPGVSSPADWEVFRDGIVMPTFSDTIEEDVYVNFHIPHHLLISAESKLHVHVHWSPGNNTDTGVVRWGLEYTYAKGHGQEAFPATQTAYINQAGPGVAYQHMIAEMSYEDAIPSTDLETDSIISIRVFRDVGSSEDTFSGDAYGFQCDIHYLKNGKSGTKNKAPDFDNHSFLRPTTGVVNFIGQAPTVL